MFHITCRSHQSVKILTLLVALLTTSCSVIKTRYEDHCKSHAYLQTPLDVYISKRFDRHAPIRIAVVPFTTQANLASQSTLFPGAGRTLAHQIHAALLSSGRLPIVEVFDRQSWPGKRDEFFTGNFGALTMARQAGYDFVLVGQVDNTQSLSQMSAHSKLIEVESGTTLWYGQSTAVSEQRDYDEMKARFQYGGLDPSRTPTTGLIELLASCIAEDVLNEDRVVPE